MIKAKTNDPGCEYTKGDRQGSSLWPHVLTAGLMEGAGLIGVQDEFSSRQRRLGGAVYAEGLINGKGAKAG